MRHVATTDHATRRMQHVPLVDSTHAKGKNLTTPTLDMLLVAILSTIILPTTRSILYAPPLLRFVLALCVLLFLHRGSLLQLKNVDAPMHRVKADLVEFKGEP